MKRLLVIRGGAVGDFVLTLPLLEAARTAHPDAEIHILGYPHIAELAVGRRLADKSDRVDAPAWAPLFSRDGTLGDGEAAHLRSFDRVISVWPDEDGVIRENLQRAGCGDVVSVNPLPGPDAAMHAIDFMARQCERFGLNFAGSDPQVYPTERDTWWVERFMRVTGAGFRPLLGIHPGSGSARKNWPVENYREIARAWTQERRGNVLLASGPVEEERPESLAPLMDMDGVFAIRGEALPRLAAALRRCEAFVGNDSGISHLAAAAGTPVVAVFGPTDPVVWGPRGKRTTTLGGGGNVRGVQVADVLAALDELLA